MLKVVLVDDEAMVIRGICGMTDWEALGMRVAGTATDGESGQKLIEQLRPDIVVADVHMPGISGLDMIRNVAQKLPGTVFIIFSGYSEFEYVRQALRYGAIDYLEKPVSIEELQRALKRAKEEVQRKAEHAEHHVKAGRSAIRETLRTNLGLPEADLSALADYGVNSSGITALTVAAGRLEDGGPMTEQLAGRAEESLHTLAGSAGFVACFRENNLLVAILLLYTTRRPDTTALFHRFRRELKGMGCALRIGLSGWHPTENISQAYAQSVQALRFSRFYATAPLCRYEDILHHADERLLAPYKAQVVRGIASGDYTHLPDALDAALSAFRENKLGPESVRHESLEMLYRSLESVTPAQRRQLDQWMADRDVPRLLQEQGGTFEEIRQLIRTLFEEMAAALSHPATQDAHYMVVKACEYIDHHYPENLTLQLVAQQVGANATYLSTLFKESLGTSYSTYLTQARIQAAKRMLREGEKVGIVSEAVGYANYRHFSELFKRLEGLSPKHYRNSPNKQDNIQR